MAFDITKTAQDTLTPEEKSWFDARLKEASDAAITAAEAERKKLIPETYDFKFSDKSPLDAKTDAQEIAAFAKKHGLSAQLAQEIVAQQEKLAGTVLTRTEAQRKQQIDGWKQEVQQDPELGGDKYQTTITNIKRVFDWLGKQLPQSKFVQLVEETGYGNHPEWVKVFNTIGKAMAEDGPTGGRFTGGGDKKADEEIVYGGKQ